MADTVTGAIVQQKASWRAGEEWHCTFQVWLIPQRTAWALDNLACTSWACMLTRSMPLQLHDQRCKVSCTQPRRSIDCAAQVAHAAAGAAAVRVSRVCVEVQAREVVDPKWISNTFHAAEPVLSSSSRVR